MARLRFLPSRTINVVIIQMLPYYRRQKRSCSCGLESRGLMSPPMTQAGSFHRRLVLPMLIQFMCITGYQSSLSVLRISPPNSLKVKSSHQISFQYRLALFQSNSPVSVRGTSLPIMDPLNQLRKGIMRTTRWV